ncbi:hypothetical protein F4802DRAFT_600786 [Xylaria palmicola]|nr:hypothetical protein F4802DRAFT_600786 [Xylaria palmicola]
MAASGPAENINYVTAALTLLILFTRIILFLYRRERVDLAFFLVVTSVVLVVARIITNAYYLRYGNASDLIKHADYFDEKNLADVRTGSILILVARVEILAILWLQVCILLLFYARITYGVSWVAWVVKATWAAVAVTFVGNVLLTFLECRPISKYWQVAPDPGYCVHAYAQLFNQTISNVLLDVLLIVIAWPIAGLRKRTVAEHVTLYTLFALGTFCIIISIIRVVYVRGSGSSQLIRSLWASIQMLVSTFVANAPNIYGSVRALRKKRSTAEGGTPPPTYGLGAARNKRPRSGLESWIKIDDHESIALAPNSQSTIRPLPPATTLYDDQAVPAPSSHPTSLEDSIHTLNEPSGSRLADTALRT